MSGDDERHDQCLVGKRAASCSFCGESKAKTGRLISGPAANVCPQCIVTMHGMLTPKEIERHTPPRESLAEAGRIIDAMVMAVPSRGKTDE